MYRIDKAVYFLSGVLYPAPCSIFTSVHVKKKLKGKLSNYITTICKKVMLIQFFIVDTKTIETVLIFFFKTL